MGEQGLTVDRQDAHTQSVPNRQFFIAVASGKGGVGKSMISANLAVGLSELQIPTLIWDADIAFPNQHILFGVEPPHRANDVYSGKISCSQAIYAVAPKLWLLAGRTSVGAVEIPPARLVETRNAISADSRFGVVIIDVSAGSSDDVLQSCAFCDAVFIISTDEPTAVIDAYGLIKILQNYMSAQSFSLIINNAMSREEAESVAQKLNLATDKFLQVQIPYLGFVPFDRSVRASIIEQKPLLSILPKSEAAQAIRHLSAMLASVIADNE